MELGTLFRLILFNSLLYVVRGYLSNSPHIITFWGQDPALQEAEKVERALNKTCGPKSSYSTVVLGFVSKSVRNKTTASLPPMHCVKSTKSRSKLSLYCPEISKKVEQCKQNKKKVLIGVGGPNETLYFDDPKSAQYFAKKIWNWFLGGTEISDMRPFGGISLDGVNIFLKDDKSKHVDVFLLTLDKLRKRSLDNKYMYTMSVPCNAPEAYFGEGKNKLSLEKIVPIVKQIYVRYSGKQCCKTGPKHFRGELQNWKKFSVSKDRPALFVLFPRSPHKTMTNCFSSNRQLNILHNIIILKRKLGNYISKRKFEYLKYLSCYVEQLANASPDYLINNDTMDQLYARKEAGKETRGHNKQTKSAGESPYHEVIEETFTKLDINKPDFSSLFASHVGHNVVPSLTLPLRYKSLPVRLKSVLGFQRPDAGNTVINPNMNLDFLLNFGKAYSRKSSENHLDHHESEPHAHRDDAHAYDVTTGNEHEQKAEIHPTVSIAEASERYDSRQRKLKKSKNDIVVDESNENNSNNNNNIIDNNNKNKNMVQRVMDENFGNTPLHSSLHDGKQNVENPPNPSVLSPSLWNEPSYKSGMQNGNAEDQVSGNDDGGNVANYDEMKAGSKEAGLLNMGYDAYTRAMNGISDILQKYSQNLPPVPVISKDYIDGDLHTDPTLTYGVDGGGFSNTPHFGGDTLYRDERYKSAFMRSQPSNWEDQNNAGLENIVSPDSSINPHSTHAPEHMDDIPNILEKLEKYITTEMQSKSKNETEPRKTPPQSFDSKENVDDDDYEDSDGDVAIKRSDAINKVGSKRTLRSEESKRRDTCFDPQSKSVQQYGQNLLAIKVVKKLLKRNLDLFNRDLKREGAKKYRKKSHGEAKKRGLTVQKKTEKKSKKAKKNKALNMQKESEKNLRALARMLQKIKLKHMHHQEEQKRQRKMKRRKRPGGGVRRTTMPLSVTWNNGQFSSNPDELQPQPQSYKSMPRLDDWASSRMRIPGADGGEKGDSSINSLIDLLLVMTEDHDKKLKKDDAGGNR